MAPEITPVVEADIEELHRVAATAFGSESKAEMVEDEKLLVEYDRMIAVRDRGRIVASAGAFSFDLTIHGGSTVPAAGVSWVGVLPTHRRRGVLRSIMQHQLDDVAARGEPVAVLTASEAVIYGRFGYGVASQHVRASVRTKNADFIQPVDDPGSISLFWSGDDKAIAVVADVYDRLARRRAGEVSRHAGYWAVVANDHEYRQNGAGPLYIAIHESADGAPDGYVLYRVKEGHSDADNIANAVELVAADASVDAALWRYLLDLDLTEKLVAYNLPIDDPLKWRLRDPRAFETMWHDDWLWARILDVPTALSARQYAADGSVVLEVVDPFRPDGAAAGTFRLEAGTDGRATCARAPGATAEVTLGVESLGTAWMGAASFTTLTAAGRASAAPDSLARADRMFAVRQAPYCSTAF